MQFFILRNSEFTQQFCCFAFKHPNLPSVIKIFCYRSGAVGVQLIHQLTHLVGVEHDRLPQIEGGVAHLEGQIADEIDLGQLLVGEPRLLAAKDDGHLVE